MDEKTLVLGDSLVKGLSHLLPRSWHVEMCAGCSTRTMSELEFGLPFFLREDDYARVFIVSGSNDTHDPTDALEVLRKYAGASCVFRVVDVNDALSSLGYVADMRVTADVGDDKLHLNQHGREILANTLVCSGSTTNPVSEVHT
jgi:hypothetical protein